MKKNTTVEATARQFHFNMDEPSDDGGEDNGPTPEEVILAGVGACTAMTPAFYAALNDIPIKSYRIDMKGYDAITVRVSRTLGEVQGQWVWGTPKTKSSARTVDLPEFIVRPLAEHLLRYPPLIGQTDPRYEGLIFSGERGGPIRRHVFHAAWAKACDAAGLKGVRVEWLRHTGASLAYLATLDLKAVSHRLGHTSVRMADQVYVNLYDETGRSMAQAISDLALSWPSGEPSDSKGG